jgi:flagellar hook-basal body complex protein FliE
MNERGDRMAITPIAGAQQSLANTAVSGTSKSENASFTDLLNEAINMTNETDAQDKAGNMAVVSGDDSGIATTMIAAQKAELALDLTIQIRNKVIDAYNEIMRMQV